ncbi:RNA polymerase sigma factor [Achromobacter xylosoxidans]|uniref:RNA polymerase sigma factor n=1 Tax=Alcaligenes xylosoxydans xylosoxydans TaxID=85698 RepID=UPI000B48D8F8|nr:sigma-70 family RNA polymerase sigma factor [Achromobacter xylosoxidans]
MSRNPLLASNTTPASADDTNGNASAIAKAYARWRLPLMHGLARFKGSIGSAEDALHDGVVKWVAASPALDSTDEQGAYLRRTVLNGVADEFRERKAGRRLQTVSFDEAEENVQTLAAGEASCPMRAAAHQQRLERLGAALQELPERQREAFVLSRFDGLTQDEVAGRMQISRRMVVKHLARAIAYCEVRVHYATVAQMQQLHRPAGDDAGLDNNNNSDSASS